MSDDQTAVQQCKLIIYIVLNSRFWHLNFVLDFEPQFRRTKRLNTPAVDNTNKRKAHPAVN